MKHKLSLPLLGFLLAPQAWAQNASEVKSEKSKAADARSETIQVQGQRLKRGSNQAVLHERQSASEVKEVLGAEQISRAGDSDAGAAMRRVSGITLLGGSRVYIRGLGERYSATSLNGLSLPSPDPSRRQIPFDLFPAEIFESIAVQKSYSPDLPAEFGGGAAQLRTKAIPNRLEAKISVGTGYNTDKVDTYQHSRTDWTGMDSGRRSLPKAAEQPLTQEVSLSGEEKESISESFPSQYSVREENAPINRNFSAAIGSPLQVGSIAGGYNFGVIYGDEWERFDRRQTELLGQDLTTVNQDTKTSVSEREIRLGGVGTFSLNVGSNSIRFMAGILRKTTDTVDRTDKINYSAGNGDAPKKLFRLQWQERELIVRQLFGEHTFDDEGRLSLAWRFASNDTKRDIPDERSYGYALETIDGIPQYAHSPTDSDTKLSRKYYANSEDLVEGQIDLNARVYEGDASQLELKFGALQQERHRNSGGREFGFALPQGYLLANHLKTGPLEAIYTPAEIRHVESTGADILLAQEETFPSDSYQARQDLRAAYAMAKYRALDQVDITAGVRREFSNQSVSSIDAFSRAETDVELDKASALPVFNANWAYTEGQQVRFAYSRTLARPDFRELSVSSFYDYERGLRVTGNADLDITEIDNFDLRWELYGDADSYVSLGGFYKTLRDPIEQVPNSVSNNLSGLTFRNAEKARNVGLELEGQKSFGANYSIGGNIMRMDSRIDVPNAAANDFRYTNSKRAMQGAAPYAVNLHSTARVRATDTEATLLYNRLGERIMEAGVYVGEVALPDVKDVPIDSLDLVLSHAVDKRTAVKFKVKNLLGRDIEYRQSEKIVYQRSQDPSYTLSLTATY